MTSGTTLVLPAPVPSTLRVRPGFVLMVGRVSLCEHGVTMTTAPPSAASGGAPPLPPVPGRPAGTGPAPYRRAWRDTRQPILGGVAGGLAVHLALPVLWIRVFFVAATALGGLGIFLYAGLWLVLPADRRFDIAPPGLESATRGGRRPGGRIRRLGDMGPVIALGALGIGAVLVAEALFGQATLFWPVLIALVGLALLWRQADEAQRERWLDTTGRVDPVRFVFGRGGWASYTRVAVGILLVAVAGVLVAWRGGSIGIARDMTLAALLGVVGIGVVVGPWLYRLAADLTAERAERVRTQERADVAAHLHDSVLQTLALIQKNAGDRATVARLARAQERDLRSWLYRGETTDERTVASALRGVGAEVEDAHGVAVDVVTVGDCDLVEGLRPVVAAAREAVANAARHAGADRVDVYAEVTPTAVDVFVRDRGVGFDPDAVPADRLGVRNSIRDRMRRHGGSAEVRSAPGEGTEVRLHLDRDQRSSRTDPTAPPSTDEESP